MRWMSWTVTVNRTEIQEMSRRLGLRPRRRSGTRIEWTDETWNPWVGCTGIAPECGLVAPGNPRPKGGGCYAAKQASRRLHEGHIGTAIKGQWTGVLKRNTPGVWKKPFGLPPGTKCFTCSMSDFWHEDVPLDDLTEAIDIIERTPWIIYQILTKRPAMAIRRLAVLGRRLPPNVWVGATVGHPKSLPLLKPLRRIEASIHFLSVEPLLAPMVPGLDLAGNDWVIGGGESPGRLRARPCVPDWMRALRDLCIARGVPFFLKQWGAWQNNPTPRDQELDPKAHGGATLDGRLWREFPV